MSKRGYPEEQILRALRQARSASVPLVQSCCLSARPFTIHQFRAFHSLTLLQPCRLATDACSVCAHETSYARRFFADPPND
jgi:hypothetical protein